MKCIICKQAEVERGSVTITLEFERTLVVVKSVPARVCPNCGEQYVDEAVSKELLKIAEGAAHSGVQVDIREYVAA